MKSSEDACTEKSTRRTVGMRSSRTSVWHRGTPEVASSTSPPSHWQNPMDRSRGSGVLIYSVVNRGNGDVEGSPEGHISVVSGWQGDLTPTARNQTIVVPVARHADGSSITGPVLSRFVNVGNGTTTVPVRSGGGYPHPATDQQRATLTMASGETVSGEKQGSVVIPREAVAIR